MTTPRRILVVEDEADLAELLVYNLRKSGFEAELARDGQSGARRIIESVPDAVLLDVMLPNLSGLQVARQVRTNPKTNHIPILMLTAKSEEIDQVAGLEVGADDYVTKPFSFKVLLARLEALLRRTKPGSGVAESTGQVVISGEIHADLSTHEVAVRGDQIKMTLTEFRLLIALMRSKGKVLSRPDLMYTAMGPDVMVTTRTIDVHMAAIRKKLGHEGGRIRTIRGVGYLLADKVHADDADDSGV